MQDISSDAKRQDPAPARAALAAMREPTEAMLDADPPYAAMHWEGNAPVLDHDLIDHWRAMIDAALGEDK